MAMLAFHSVDATESAAPSSIPFRDRRKTPRLPLACRVFLKRPGDESAIATETEDISCQGFYCISELPFAPHEKLECKLMIRSGAPGDSIDLILQGVVEVIRVVASAKVRGFGIACRLESYSIGMKSDSFPNDLTAKRTHAA
jgi:hypothetical protein